MKQSLPPGAAPTTYHLYERLQWRKVEAAVVEEAALCIYVNGQELATLMCSPIDQEALALGFLSSEEFIKGWDDIETVELSQGGTCVDAWLKGEFVRPQRGIKTTGCGGGVTFDDLAAEHEPLSSDTKMTIAQLNARYGDLTASTVLYPITRGLHIAILCTPDELLLMAEDVGRHNTLDKLWGKAMQAGIDTAGRVLITTGRISSEMLGKAAKMGVPIIASRTSPTSRSLALAEAWNMTVVGYLRKGGLRVYVGRERIIS